ncbi:MAG: 2-dehydropantoate 2-reductase [Bacteroidales bacterium]|nr:2-dehydropantoate 2-reductase [Bacteroidales bacterium]
MKYAVIGVGGVGGYFGGRLANVGRDVCFLMHSDYEYVCQNGLRVDSCRGNFLINPIKAYKTPEDLPVCDVVLVALKTVNNALLPKLLSHVAGPDTLVVLIQNGIGMEDDLQAAMPGLQIAAATAFICSAKTGPGHISHMDYGTLTIANYSCRDKGIIEALVRDLTNSGVETFQAEYKLARWRKAVWNMPFNGMTVALDASTAQLLSNPSTRALIYDQMLEVINAANACGVKLDASFADKMMANTDKMTPYKPSMKLDYDNGRPMEIEYLYTRPLAIAATAGYPMPRLQMLEAQLRFLSSK